MTIKEACELLDAPHQKLLNQLKRKYPSKNWTVDSEIPEELVEQIEAGSANYKEASSLGGKLSVQEAHQITQEAIEWGILEAVENFQISTIHFQGQIHGMREIEAFEEGKSQVWRQFYADRAAKASAALANAESRCLALGEKAKAKLADGLDFSKSQTELQRKLADLQSMLAGGKPTGDI